MCLGHMLTLLPVDFRRDNTIIPEMTGVDTILMTTTAKNRNLLQVCSRVDLIALAQDHSLGMVDCRHNTLRMDRDRDSNRLMKARRGGRSVAHQHQAGEI